MLRYIIGIVGALGIVGTIALVVLAPLLAREILGIVLDTLTRIWKTRTGCALLTAAACLTFGLYYFDHQGASRVKAQWDAANAEAAAKVVKADADAAAKARVIEDRDIAAEQTADATAAEARNAYITELEKRAANVCVYSPDDIKRLLRSR